jgi:signal transduction histidine kinase
MSAWLSALAHEIRNPLNTMRLNLQLLQEDWNQPGDFDRGKALKRLDTLSKEVNRQEEILTDFLRLARLPEPDFRTSDVSLLLHELLDFMEPETQQSNIEVIRDFQGDLAPVELDSGQIKQAILNIILNANQAMPEGGQLAVKAYNTNDHISIDISDTGEGIRPDRVAKLFDLFYSTKKEGTGLGLAIVKRIVDMHGGEIRVESQEGEGTTFSIILPIRHDKHLVK